MLQAFAARLRKTDAPSDLAEDAYSRASADVAAPPPAPVAPPQPFHVEVADGTEVLFAQPFEAGTFTIGASPAADIIIPDLDEPEIASVKLETVGSACLVTVTALAPGVGARGRELAVGKPVLFPERARFRIADAYDFEIAFTPPTRALTVERSSLPAIMIAMGAMLAALGFTLGGGAPEPETAPARPEIVADAAAPVVVPASLPPAAQMPIEPASPVSRLVAAEERLRRSFAATGLVPQLRVAANGARLVIEGDLTREERERAIDVIDGFRAQEAVPVELALVSDAREADFFATVVLEPETFLIAPDGRRFGPSQRLPDGRTIVSIDETTILVEREGVLERILYAP